MMLALVGGNWHITALSICGAHSKCAAIGHNTLKRSRNYCHICGLRFLPYKANPVCHLYTSHRTMLAGDSSSHDNDFCAAKRFLKTTIIRKMAADLSLGVDVHQISFNARKCSIYYEYSVSARPSFVFSLRGIITHSTP